MPIRVLSSRSTWVVAVIILSACKTPFPGPADPLPDCEFGPSTEDCGAKKDDGKRRDAPYTKLADSRAITHQMNPSNSELPIYGRR